MQKELMYSCIEFNGKIHFLTNFTFVSAAIAETGNQGSAAQPLSSRFFLLLNKEPRPVVQLCLLSKQILSYLQISYFDCMYKQYQQV